jgi:uncharacterized repeat protein (TIGR02059 family)
LKNVLIIIFLVFNTIASATDYYISSSGKDTNNGLSSSAPWKTIAKVNASSFSPGDTIFFNKGDTWREPLTVSSSGSESAYITFASYGAGSAPKILGSEEVTSWIYDTGNVWYSKNAVDDPYALSRHANIYFKETNGNISWGRAEKVEKKDLTVEYDWGWISNHIYIYSSTDPNTRYSGAEITQREICVDMNSKEYLAFNGLEIAYSGNWGITGDIPYSELSGLIVRNCHIHHIGIKGSVGAYGLSIWYSDMLIKDNIIHDCGRRLISLYLYNQVIHPHDVIIDGNTLYDGYHTSGIDINTNAAGSWKNIIIRNNIFYQNTNSIDAVENPTVENIFIAEQGTLTGSVSDVYIYNNIFKNPNYYSILLEHASSIYIYNNTFYGDNPAATTLNGGFIGMSGAGSYTIKNNIFYNNISHSTNANFRCLAVASTTGTAISDYNLFYKTDESQTLVSWHSTGYASSQWATYKKVSGQDAHSPTPDDPFFVSSSDYHLRAGSPAIGTGVNIGLKTDYDGNAFKNPPSIGAYEYDSKRISQVIPVYQSSVVGNATPNIVEIIYDLILGNIMPAASAFTVKVNSVSRIVNSVAISGAKVLLTLSSPVIYGDVVTVSYSKPSVNPLQTPSGGQAASLIAQTVTNNVASLTLPIYVSSSVENATPSILVITYNMALANLVPAASAFSVHVNSAVRTVNAVAVSGTKVQLTLASPIIYGDVMTFSYTKPISNPLQTASGGIAASISNQTVINNCINIAPTVVITSPIMNDSFTASANITITANALDPDGSISIVEFYNGTTKLGSISTAPYSFTWNNVTTGTYSLTAVAYDNLNSKTKSSALSISVNNGTPLINQPPVIKISNPSKGGIYKINATITIDAVAFDPDGSISKVEFYSGAVKLVELTSAPYTYTLKDAKAGTYSITAVATDNLNATTTSLPLEFEVGSSIRYDANSEIINLYPNPSDGHFSIKFVNPLQNEKSAIVITDLAGKQVFQGTLLKEETIKQIDLSYIKSGVYLLMILCKEIIVTKKIIKY